MGVAPVLFHLRKHSKHCRSENLRRQIKQLVSTAEAAAGDVTSRRENLSEKDVTTWKKFFLFESDSQMAKARAEAIARKDREERQRVEAETRSDGQKNEAEIEEPSQDKKTKTNTKKREHARERKKS